MARRNSNKPQHQQLHKTPMINYIEDDVNVGGAGPRLSSSKLIQDGSKVKLRATTAMVSLVKKRASMVSNRMSPPRTKMT